MTQPRTFFALSHKLAAVLLLWLMFTLAVHSLVQKSPTFDEQAYLVHGLAYWRDANRDMRLGHPLGLNLLNTLLLAGDESVRLPLDDPAWGGRDFHRPSDLFLWEIGNDVEKIMLLGRTMTVFLGLLLAALVGRWAYALTRNRWAGVFALTLIALDPNILAHTRLITTDLGITAAAAFAGYTLWRYLTQPTSRHLITAAITFGLLSNTRFTAALFIPAFALAVLAAWLTPNHGQTNPFLSHPHRRTALAFILLYPLIAFFTLWALYAFQIGPIAPELAPFSWLAGKTVPLSHHFNELFYNMARAQRPTAAFLLGQYTRTGWWYYYPVAFLLKTPIPTLMLFGWAGWQLATAAWRQTWRANHSAVVNFATTLLPPLSFFTIALFTRVNLGYRLILPILPFLIVFTASVLPIPNPRRLPYWRSYKLNYNHYALFALTGWLLAATLYTAPHFLPYFNSFVGRQDNGWQYLVDSNLDWGQDLKALKGWMENHAIDHVWLSYFGEARPEYYQINYMGLDSFPPRLMHPTANPFYPHDPAPGIYAISATNLQGVLFQDHDQFAIFRPAQPLATVGHSIRLYEVAPYGQPTALLLGAVSLQQITAADYATMRTNNVTPRWFEPDSATLIPATDRAWLALADPSQPNGYSWQPYERPPDSDQTLSDAVTLTTAPDGCITLSSHPELALDNGRLTLTTAWQQQGAPQAVKIFIHAMQGDNLITQWDGLGVLAQSWQTGDILLQHHTLDFPPDAPTGPYTIWAGLYNPATGQRWQTAAGADRIPLTTIER